MRIRIYQIDFDHDELLLAFRPYETVISKCGGIVPAQYYQKVYEGNTLAQTLEDVFCIFNQAHPSDFRARSLSVSDVVEVLRRDGSSRFYYCDSFGFKPIAFEVKDIIGGSQNGM